MADFLEDKKREIRDRLKELKPLVEEYHRLEAAASALDGVPANGAGGASAPAQRRTRGTGRRSSAGAGAGAGRRGRPKGSGTRSKQALELVRAQPGITIPELADAMGIKQNYLYRVLPSLAQEGLVSKKGRGWHAKDAA
jgi:CRP-like cAMP-binding protein